MVLWTPGMSLEEVEHSTILAAIAFYKDEERAAVSLKITAKEMSKITKKIADNQKKVDEIKEIERKKYEEFMFLARGGDRRLL
jgi:hypothetical protein